MKGDTEVGAGGASSPGTLWTLYSSCPEHPRELSEQSTEQEAPGPGSPQRPRRVHDGDRGSQRPPVGPWPHLQPRRTPRASRTAAKIIPSSFKGTKRGLSTAHPTPTPPNCPGTPTWARSRRVVPAGPPVPRWRRRTALSGDRNRCSTLMVPVRLCTCPGTVASGFAVPQFPQGVGTAPSGEWFRAAYLVGSPGGDQHGVPRELEEAPAAHPALLPQPPPQAGVQVAAGGLRRDRPVLPRLLGCLWGARGERSRGPERGRGWWHPPSAGIPGSARHPRHGRCATGPRAGHRCPGAAPAAARPGHPCPPAAAPLRARRGQRGRGAAGRDGGTPGLPPYPALPALRGPGR